MFVDQKGENKIKVLQILPTLNLCGGVENYLMNYYTHMDLSDISIDFCVHSLEDDYFQKMIENRGGHVYVLPKFSFKTLVKIKKMAREIMKNGHYDIIHCHQANAAFLYFKIAQKEGIAHRILHSHQASAADKFLHRIRNLPLLKIGVNRATEHFACSKLAGQYLYGKKSFTVINNAIDVSRFSYNPAIREEVREQLGIQKNTKLIGHVGRFCRQKNQEWLVKLFYRLNKIENNTKLILIGDGETRDKCEMAVKKYGLQSQVLFLGVRKDTERLYQAMDVFVLPSLYEGLPVVGIEAQAAGLPMVLSDRITQEVCILDNTRFVSLAAEDKWVQYILLDCLNDRSEGADAVIRAGYEINIEQKKLKNAYLEMARK